MSEVKAGSLYVVATPIGNLEDLSPRAAAVLGRVALVAAEDTRHSARLMRHLGVAPTMVSVHDHNEASRVELLKRRLLEGDDVALISDAGTPLISDPGFVVVRELRQQGFSIVPIPGPCALITALSAAGLPTSSFTFHGFLPAKGSGRRARLETWRGDTGTQVCYESPHRIKDLLADLAALLGMVEYSDTHSTYMTTAYPKREIVNTLGEWVARHGLTQFRLAETEKYPHVTFFLNGGKETPEEGEDRFMPKSPKVATYDMQPEMSEPEVAEKFVEAIERATGKMAIRDYQPMQPGDIQHTWADTAPLYAATGFQPRIDVATGVERFVSWYRTYYHTVSPATTTDARRAGLA